MKKHEKLKIHINKGIEIKEFIKDVSQFSCDVNFYDGHRVCDAKSLMAVLTLDLSKDFEIQCISDDPDILQHFEEVMKRYQ